MMASPTSKRRIHVVATGGTIAGMQTDPALHGYRAGTLGVETLLDAIPNLADLALVTGEQAMNIPSQDMDDQAWLALARRLNVLATMQDVDGIVVTHGTDTMEETAFFIDLTVQAAKPIVFTGAMRPATALSADGPMNMFNAVAVAAAEDAQRRGTLIVMNDTILTARDAYKLHTSRVDAFQAPDRGMIGHVDTGHPVFHAPSLAQLRPAFDIDGWDDLPNVVVLYAHAGMTSGVVDAARAAGAEGLIVAGVGNGNTTAPAFKALADAARHGVAVVRSTRLSEGVVMRNAEVDDDGLGFVVSNEFKPGKARILLQLALTRTRDPRAIQAIFNQA